MTDFVGMNEGKVRILTAGGGMPATTHFALITNPIATNLAAPAAGDIYAGSVYADITEASWSGSSPYARLSQTTPVPSALGVISFLSDLVWLTGTATNGPATIRTLIALDNAQSKLIFAWNIKNLINANVDIPMNTANRNLTITAPINLFLQNVGGN